MKFLQELTLSITNPEQIFGGLDAFFGNIIALFKGWGVYFAIFAFIIGGFSLFFNLNQGKDLAHSVTWVVIVAFGFGIVSFAVPIVSAIAGL
jgi:hypothetical protein